MFKVQYYNGIKWTTVSEWHNAEIGWASLGNDNLNYRLVDENGRILKHNFDFNKK